MQKKQGITESENPLCSSSGPFLIPEAATIFMSFQYFQVL